MILDRRHSYVVSNPSFLSFDVTLFFAIKGGKGAFNSPHKYFLSNHFSPPKTGVNKVASMDISLDKFDELVG